MICTSTSATAADAATDYSTAIFSDCHSDQRLRHHCALSMRRNTTIRHDERQLNSYSYLKRKKKGSFESSKGQSNDDEDKLNDLKRRRRRSWRRRRRRDRMLLFVGPRLAHCVSMKRGGVLSHWSLFLLLLLFFFFHLLLLLLQQQQQQPRVSFSSQMINSRECRAKAAAAASLGELTNGRTDERTNGVDARVMVCA